MTTTPMLEATVNEALLAACAACLLVLAYTYVGYPVVIGILAKLWPMKLVEEPAWRPTVSVLIPVHNAACYLVAKVESLLALQYPADRLEILVYSDGSDDDTPKVARELAAKHPTVKVIIADQRLGKPAGVNRMLEIATGEVLLMTDVRQPLVEGALTALVSKLADERVACVSGNLILEGEAGAGAYWRYENWIRAQEARFRGMVGVTGPLYAIRKRDMARLPSTIVLDDMWVPLRLRLAGKRIVFAEGAMCTDDAFGDQREYGRKVRTLAGNYQLFSLLPGLLIPFKNPSWFETFSHKIMRLVCPWALGVLLASSVGALWTGGVEPLEAWGLRALLGGQAIFYLLALLGDRTPVVRRGGSLARTFVVLNGAAIVGLYRFLRGAQKVTW
jgi:biofilm PGA synthesis N-glycosyltransferase PgaC